MTTPKARCYMEMCCNPATYEIVLIDRSASQTLAPILWGWCSQHKHEAWSQRNALIPCDCGGRLIPLAPQGDLWVCETCNTVHPQGGAPWR